MQPTLDYYTYRALTAKLGDDQVRYFSKPGIPDWDTISPAYHLLIENAYPDPQDHIWCINCGAGALAVALSKQVFRGSCTVSANDILTLSATQHSQLENNLSNLHIHDDIHSLPQPQENINLILMGLSKSRGLNRRWLRAAIEALKPGGRLLLAGANEQGIQSTIRDAGDLFTNQTILAYKKGNRVAQFIKPESSQPNLPGWALESGIAPGTWNCFEVDIPGLSLDLVSLPGVFSHNRLDEGTQLFLTTFNDFVGKKVLDVGCGYGLLGIFAAIHGASNVVLVDNNLFAIASCQENLRRHQFTGCQAYYSDLLSGLISQSYNCILSNPPFHSGHQIDYQLAKVLITGAHSLLETNGYLQLVANRFIRYDRLMWEVFGNVESVAATRAYHVLASQKGQV